MNNPSSKGGYIIANKALRGKDAFEERIAQLPKTT